MHWLGLLKGGPGSGNFGHAGRPGEVGGSAPDGEQGSGESSSKVRQWAESKFKDKEKADSFSSWFRGSKVTSDSGEPLTVYHVTTEDFEEFDPKMGAQGVGWFTSNKEKINSSETGASLRPGKTPRVIEAHLSIQKMAGWDEYEKYSLDELESQGYDGVKLDDDYIIFEANQVRQVKPEAEGSGKSSPKVRQWAEEKFKDKQTAENFARWFGDSKVVDKDGNPLRVFHGTTENFEEFDTSIRLTDGRDRAAFFSDSEIVAASYTEHQPLEEKKRMTEAENLRAELESEYDRLTGDLPPERENAFIHAINNAEGVSVDEANRLIDMRDRLEKLESGLDLEESAALYDSKKPQMKAVYLSLQNPYISDSKGGRSDWTVPTILQKVDRSKHDGIIFRNIVDTGDGTNTVSTVYAVFSPTSIKSAIGNSGTFDPDNPNITKSHKGFHQWMSLVKGFTPDSSKIAKSVDRIEAMTLECLRHIKGGPGSGNFGHAGRPGQVGGSAPDDSPSSSSSTPKDVPKAPAEPRDTDLVTLGKYDDPVDVTGKRRVTLFHYSSDDRSDSGLQRKYAGTAGAGEEKRSFEYDKEGKLIEESAPIHAYMYGAKRESMVPGKVLHRIDTELNVIDVTSKEYADILAEAQKEAEKTGRPMLAMARVITRQRGYDALASTRDGIVQILRDVSPAELETVGKKGASTKIGYTPKPPADSDYVDEYKRRWETKISNLAKEKPEVEIYSLNNGADVMVNMGLLSKEDRHAVVGNLVGRELTLEKVNATVDELISKIPKSAREKDVEYIKNYWKYAIVAGKSKEEIQANIEEQQRNLLKNVNNRVAVRVPLEFVDSVIKDGRLKSQFETGESKGALDPQLRRNVEYNGFGVPRDHPADKRPIYGYMADESASMHNTTLEYYGGIALIMKDEVKERSTVTFGDSLDNGLPASDIKSPSLTSMRVVEGVLNEDSFTYIEAQLHGGVSIDDVKEVVINEFTMRKIIKSYSLIPANENSKLPFGNFDRGGKLLSSNLKISVCTINKRGGPAVVRTLEDWIESSDYKDTHWDTPEGRVFAEKVGKRSGR